MRGQGKVESTEVKENRKWQCLAMLNECWCAADGNECLEWGETEVSVGQRGRERDSRLQKCALNTTALEITLVTHTL